MNFDANPIILHVFSNGGAYLYQHIDLAIKEFQTPLDVCCSFYISVIISKKNKKLMFSCRVSDLWYNLWFIARWSSIYLSLSSSIVDLWQRAKIWLHYFSLDRIGTRCQMGSWGKKKCFFLLFSISNDVYHLLRIFLSKIHNILIGYISANKGTIFNKTRSNHKSVQWLEISWQLYSAAIFIFGRRQNDTTRCKCFSNYPKKLTISIQNIHNFQC